MKNLMAAAKMLAVYGQVGFTVAAPPVVMALLGHWLQKRYFLGSWVVAVAVLVGITAAVSGAYRFYRRVLALEKEKNEKKTKDPVVYYNHD